MFGQAIIVLAIMILPSIINVSETALRAVLMKENRRNKRNFVAFWRKMAYNQMLKSNEKYRRGPRAF